MPISSAAAGVSAQGMPISHITGRNGRANSSCRVQPPGSACRAALTRLTSATATSSVVVMPTSGPMPSAVPRTSASRLFSGGSRCNAAASLSCFAAPGPAPGPNGTISAATASAAGVLMTEATRIAPSAFGSTGPSTVA